MRIDTLVDAQVGGSAAGSLDVWPVYLPIRHLSAFLNSLDKGACMAIESDEKKVSLVCGMDRAEFTFDWIHGAGAEAAIGAMPYVQADWSRPPVITSWSAPGGTLAAMRAASIAASDDECRPVLTQVHLDPDGEAVATNSYTLVRVRCETPPEVLAIDRRVVRAIPKDSDGAIFTWDSGSDVYGTFLEVACDTATTIRRRRHTCGEFPTYKPLIPNGGAVLLALDRDKAIRQMASLAMWASGSIEAGRLVWNGEHIEWLCKGGYDDGTVRTGVLECTDRREPSPQLTVAFNPEYWLEGLRSIPSPVIHWTMTDNLKPSLLSDPEGTHEFVIMPVRVA